MWIVKLVDNNRHSAWLSKNDALHQVEVLKEYGYYRFIDEEDLVNFVELDETVVCEDGHYYV